MTVSPRQIMADFPGSAQKICRKTDLFLKKYGVNVAAGFGILGGSLQGYFAQAAQHAAHASTHITASDPRIQIAAAVCNVVSPVAGLAAGQHHIGVKTSAVAGVLGPLLTFGPQLLAGDKPTWVSFGVLAAAMTVSFASDRYAKRNEGSALFRKISGAMLFASHTTMAVINLRQGQVRTAVPFAIWSGGDVVFSRSVPQVKKPRRPERPVVQEAAPVMASALEA